MWTVCTVIIANGAATPWKLPHQAYRVAAYASSPSGDVVPTVLGGDGPGPRSKPKVRDEASLVRGGEPSGSDVPGMGAPSAYRGEARRMELQHLIEALDVDGLAAGGDVVGAADATLRELQLMRHRPGLPHVAPEAEATVAVG
jgi:hypothetical protein